VCILKPAYQGDIYIYTEPGGQVKMEFITAPGRPTTRGIQKVLGNILLTENER
jgi:hypothetical protein